MLKVRKRSDPASMIPDRKRPHGSPKVIIYHQSHYPNGEYLSMLPMATSGCGITHVIIAAIHVNHEPGDITLNDDPFLSPKSMKVWTETRQLQGCGIRVLGMLGGAAVGTFTRLDNDNVDVFNSYYEPLRECVKSSNLDGLDLDVEEEMSLRGIIRLIDRLRSDFGSDFLITLAPTASAMWGGRHLSGFSYDELEKQRGNHIAWYNTMFYCGWGSMQTTEHFERIMDHGWNPERIVVGLSTNPETNGWIHGEVLQFSLGAIAQKYPSLGGVMGWEYFNAIMANEGAPGEPWEWLQAISMILSLAS
jgi:Glycosyl hydrolases family 18